MSEIFDSMLSAYPVRTSKDKRNAVHEEGQEELREGRVGILEG